MLKFQTLVAAGIGTALVVPALGDDRVALLENALAETTRALEVLAGIEELARDGDAEAIALVRSATEAPLLDPRQRDDRLMLLRNEVSLLQTEVDALEATPLGSDVPPATDDPTLGSPDRLMGPVLRSDTLAGTLAGTQGPDAMRPLTTGLSDLLRDSLAEDPNAPAMRRAATVEDTIAKSTTKRSPVSGEGAGYTADPAGHARVCFRAGRYAEGLAVVPEDTGDAEALFWRARCLEKLDRIEEALAALRRAEELAGVDSALGQRAQNQLSFLEWRQDFHRKSGAASAGGER